jgi:hypothetical protein
MNLVEIAFWRLLEKEFNKTLKNVNIRKTTTYDDTFSWIDYIIEYLDDKWNVSWVVGVDLYSWDNSETLKEKEKKRKYTKAIEYEKYRGKRIYEIPRIVIQSDRNLLYSFTNNYFAEVYDSGEILDSKKLQEILNYSLEDLVGREILWTENKLSKNVKNLVEDSKWKVKELI